MEGSCFRQLLNSPLLNRRRNKKPSESSDDEYSSAGGAAGYSEVNSKNYRDLESFQKAQLRNKVPYVTSYCRHPRKIVVQS